MQRVAELFLLEEEGLLASHIGARSIDKVLHLVIPHIDQTVALAARAHQEREIFHVEVREWRKIALRMVVRHHSEYDFHGLPILNHQKVSWMQRDYYFVPCILDHG